jgi:SAM-dependent methyltransferase
MSGVFSYGLYKDVRESYSSTLIELAKSMDVSAVAELGGGAKPSLGDEASWSFVPTRVVYDVDPGELDKAGDGLEKRTADLCQPLHGEADTYDLVFSKMLCEHLVDPEVFHRNCFRLLRPGGMSVHFYPTLYAAPFLLNRIIPETTALRLVGLVQPGRLDDARQRKFPAYYRWCHGPTSRSVKRFESVGFEIHQWRVVFGHSYYKRIPPLQALEEIKSRFLVRHPVPALSAYAMVVLRKPTSV